MGQTAENGDCVKVKLNSTSKEHHITLIKSPLAGNFGFHTAKKILLYWGRLHYPFDPWGSFHVCHPQNLQFLNLDRKILVLSVYCFEHTLHEKSYTTLLERQLKLLGLRQYYFWVLKDPNVSITTTCLHISHLVPSRDMQQPFFSRGAITRMPLKLLALLNLIIGTFSKTRQCSLSGVNTNCI